MKKDGNVEQMKRKYARLSARVGKLGPVLQGTITERTIQRKDPEQPGKERSYGPYYQWTFKRDGKTTTVNLSASQVKAYQRAIEEHRKMEVICQEMRELSLAILEESTTGVKRRKSKG